MPRRIALLVVAFWALLSPSLSWAADADAADLNATVLSDGAGSSASPANLRRPGAEGGNSSVVAGNVSLEEEEDPTKNPEDLSLAMIVGAGAVFALYRYFCGGHQQEAGGYYRMATGRM